MSKRLSGSVPLTLLTPAYISLCAVSSAICNGLFGRTSTALVSSVTCVLHSNPDFTSAVSHNDLLGPPTYPLIGLRDLLAICSLASIPLWHGKGTLHASKDSTTRATLPIQKDPRPREWYHERHVYLVPFCEQKAPLAPLFPISVMGRLHLRATSPLSLCREGLSLMVLMS